MKYKKRPVIVHAIQYLGPHSIDEMREEWGKDFDVLITTTMDLKSLMVKTRNGWLSVKVNDYVIKGEGEYYPCPQDVFDLNYEPV